MNREKSRLTLLALVGAYLAYTGGGLIYEVIQEQPDNSIIFWGFGLFFIVLGGYVLITKGKAIMQLRKEEMKDAEIESGENKTNE